MALQTVNPSTAELVEQFAEWTSEQTADVINDVAGSWRDWRSTTFRQRAGLMRQAAAVLRRRSDELAGIMALEMGKPVSEGRAEVEKCAWVCEYFAEHAARFLQDTPMQSDASSAYVACRPLGTILAVMPWNFPFWQVFRFAAPAMMAGNTAVLKHASNVPRCALTIEDIFHEAGFPKNVFRTLMIGSAQVGHVIENEHIRAVTLTGSCDAGRKVASKAGAMLKKTLLELGGSDPFIVLNDADMQQAATVGAKSRCINSGQSCIAAKRFIVEAGIHDAFVEKLVDAMSRLTVGDPAEEKTQVGPLAREDLRNELDTQVRNSVKLGARVLLGGKPLDRRGYFYAPTVLAGVDAGMPVHDEEVFGPVAAVIRARDAEHAVAVANNTRFGLGASIWTLDTGKGEDLAAGIESGAVFINGLVKSDPRLPFGGIKESGYGRELSHYGILEFVNIQTVWLKQPGSA